MENISSELVSVIVPTIGRPESLCALLESLSIQTERVQEVIIADGSNNDLTERVINEPRWRSFGLVIKRVHVIPPNAVRQRQAAIQQSTGELLLFLDDDVVLEPDCVEQMLEVFEKYSGTIGVFADFSNQSWSQPTLIWKLYLRLVHGIGDGEWNGRVVGPLLRFGYTPIPIDPQPIEWIGTGNTMVKKSAYEQCKGFSDFFLHRCTMNEDVDLGIKLSRVGKIIFCPAARMAHYPAPGGRVTETVAAEDDLFNRFYVLYKTVGYGLGKAFGLVLIYFLLETIGSFIGAIRRLNFNGFFPRLSGRLRALRRIILPIAHIQDHANEKIS